MSASVHWNVAIDIPMGDSSLILNILSPGVKTGLCRLGAVRNMKTETVPLNNPSVTDAFRAISG